MKKTYSYEVVCRFFYMLHAAFENRGIIMTVNTPAELALIIGMQGVFGGKTEYTKESFHNLRARMFNQHLPQEDDRDPPEPCYE